MCTTGISLPSIDDNSIPLDLSFQTSVQSTIDKGTCVDICYNTLYMDVRKSTLTKLKELIEYRHSVSDYGTSLGKGNRRANDDLLRCLCCCSMITGYP